MVENRIDILIKTLYDSMGLGMAQRDLKRFHKNAKLGGDVFGKIFSQDLTKAKSKLGSFNDVLKQTGVSFIDNSRKMKGLSAQNLVDTSKLNQKLPTTQQLIKGIGDTTQNWNSILSQSENLGKLAVQGFDVSKLRVDLKKVGKQAGVMGSQLDKSFIRGRASMHKFQMGWLSVMFAAMKVKRIMTGLWKDMAATFKKVAGKAHPLNTAMTRLEAGFTFLKFAILDAMGPMLERFVLWLANLAITIAEMDPKWLKRIGIALLVITGLAFVAGFVAEFMLLAGGIKILSASGVGSNLGTIAKNLKKITTLKNIGGILGTVITVAFTVKAVRMLTEDGTTIIDDLQLLAMGAIGGALLGFYFGGPIGALIGAAIGASLSVIISVVDIIIELKKAFPDTFWKELLDTAMPDTWQTAVVTAGGYLVGIPILVNLIPNFIKKGRKKLAGESGLEDINESVKELAMISTPEAINAMQKLWDEGTIQKLASSITTEEGGLIPAFDGATDAVGRVQTATDTLQTDWDDWTPSEKTFTIKIKEIRESSGGNSSGSRGRVQTTTSYGTGN